MPTIHITTFVQSPADRVFDLARSIDLHKKSMAHTKEEAVGGTRMGLINLQETVTWKAKHLGKTRLLKSKITAMHKPDHFTDEMVEGDFRSLKHEHYFKPIVNGTLMIDYFEYELPYGMLGRFLDLIFLKNYLTKLIERRNEAIKKYAESDQWSRILNL